MKIFEAERMNVSFGAMNRKCNRIVSKWSLYQIIGIVKPCPHCGNEKIFLKAYVDKLLSRFRLECENCEYLGRVKHSIIGAILTWNIDGVWRKHETY